jgi:hypothetical protein
LRLIGSQIIGFWLVYSKIYFGTYSLPCFNELYSLFYFEGVKVVPENIFELLTPLSLCYWICDDGGFNKRNRAVILSTQSFTQAEVGLLAKVLAFFAPSLEGGQKKLLI